MSILRWQGLTTSERVPLLTQRYASLWILPSATAEEVRALATVPWVNVWNGNSTIDVQAILTSVNTSKSMFVVHSAADDVGDFSAHTFTRIYMNDAPINSNFAGLEKFKILELKSRVSTVAGIIVIAGSIADGLDDILFISDLAPHLYIVGFENGHFTLPHTAQSISLCLFQNIDQFIGVFKPQLEDFESNIVNLKNAENIRVDYELLEAIERDWTFLTASRISSGPINQDQFDGFLNGDTEWTIYSAGVAYSRPIENRLKDNSKSKRETLTELLAQTIADIESKGTDPRDPLRQMRLFCEPGSGTTTCLRQAAVEIARLGYPVLISNPYPKHLSPATISRFIIDTQDRWRQARKGPGAGHGNIPFILLVDKDLDEEVEHQRLARALADLGREAILVRAFERSRDEIARARDVLALRADVSEGEMLKIGAHLRNFALAHELEPVPSDEEWRAYHRGLGTMAVFNTAAPVLGTNEDIPHLFLVGILPFISDRIRDVNSLQQYYYQKWDSISDAGLKLLVHTVAAAGSFGIGVPYDSLRRINELNIGALEGLSRLSERLMDVFIHWQHEGNNTTAWYLRVRHPIVGRLLSRVIDPIEGDVPYKPLISILRNLTTKDDDVWFARNLMVRVGKDFKRRAQSFSLETDTPIQRAARTLFSAIPLIVKRNSRALVHHEARYHMHVLHACLDALNDPLTTTLSRSTIEEILNDEYRRASDLLETALTIDDWSEPEKFILNTRALLNFNFADAASKESEVFAQRFIGGVNIQEDAVGFDAADALARYQFVHEIFTKVPNGSWGDREKLELYSRAEIRLQELISINQEMTIKNADPADAELQIATLFDLYRAAMAAIPNATSLINDFKVQNPEAWIALAVRRELNTLTLEEGFRRENATALRDLRTQLQAIDDKSARSLILLYRMYLGDPMGRLEYRTRLSILAELKRKSPTEYVSYWHDEAALLCQLDNLQRGTERFAELRAFRRGQRAMQLSQWIWVNERVLLRSDGTPHLRQVALVVKDPSHGIAAFHGTRINTRYQPYQFADLKTGQVFSAYIRFTLSGTQAVSEALAMTDLKTMALS